MIDCSKPHQTRGGRPVEELTSHFTFLSGYVDGSIRFWTVDGRSHDHDDFDLVPDNPPPPQAPDPLVEEFGRFVAAVRINAQRGNFSRPTDHETLEEWIDNHTPILRSRIRKP